MKMLDKTPTGLEIGIKVYWGACIVQEDLRGINFKLGNCALPNY
jgi:hypothetical protein